MEKRVTLTITLQNGKTAEPESTTTVRRDENCAWTFDGPLFPKYLHMLSDIEAIVREVEKNG